MWYVLQTIIAVSLAYVWCGMPEHSPKDFGHGLFLGILVSWYITAICSALLDYALHGSRGKQTNLVTPAQRLPSLEETSTNGQSQPDQRKLLGRVARTGS